MTRVHHTAIVVDDVAASLHFWRDCIGFETLMDQEFDGAWTTLFGAPADQDTIAWALYQWQGKGPWGGRC